LLILYQKDIVGAPGYAFSVFIERKNDSYGSRLGPPFEKMPITSVFL